MANLTAPLDTATAKAVIEDSVHEDRVGLAILSGAILRVIELNKLTNFNLNLHAYSIRVGPKACKVFFKKVCIERFPLTTWFRNFSLTI